MQVARWALIGASLLAAFQAWLWAGQGSLIGLAGAMAFALALIAAVHLPGTRYALVLGRAWDLPRASGESERRYRFKIALAWMLVVTLCVLGCIALRSRQSVEVSGVALQNLWFRRGADGAAVVSDRTISLVEASSMKLYAHPFSSYTQKVLIALYENAIAFEYRSLEDAAANAELASLWPLKRFPVLVDGEHTDSRSQHDH